MLAAVFCVCLAVDQLTKSGAKRLLPHSGMLSFLGDTVRLGYTENQGGFLSLGASLNETWKFYLFVVSVSVILGLVGCYLIFASYIRPTIAVALSLLFSGGASNLVDRVLLGGRVVDFMNIGVGPLRTGVFNVADMALTAAALLILLDSMRDGLRKKRRAGDAEASRPRGDA